ncbi:hypothetical protein VKT23_013693 [Stygiomarasmius scandens]|uniref:Uncharacterized protein n=1 Tax=Marasmiellus scandens TaxID=2682957 RepID=A0ABR1J7B6_9AGAR
MDVVNARKGQTEEHRIQKEQTSSCRQEDHPYHEVGNTATFSESRGGADSIGGSAKEDFPTWLILELTSVPLEEGTILASDKAIVNSTAGEGPDELDDIVGIGLLETITEGIVLKSRRIDP